MSCVFYIVSKLARGKLQIPFKLAPFISHFTEAAQVLQFALLCCALLGAIAVPLCPASGGTESQFSPSIAVNQDRFPGTSEVLLTQTSVNRAEVPEAAFCSLWLSGLGELMKQFLNKNATNYHKTAKKANIARNS